MRRHEMKTFNKMTAIMLILSMTVFSPSAAFAKDIEKNQQRDAAAVTALGESSEDTQSDAASEELGNGKQKPWKAERETLKLEKAEIEILKDQTETEIGNLETQLEAAEASGDAVLAESLKAQIESLKTVRDGYKEEMKQKIEEMKQVMRDKYSEQELIELSLVGQSLAAEENVQIIPVENILVKNRDVKFDTPPVIKQGRTLIPVRAIAESTGATVDWDGETQTVTIVKGEKEIVFNLSENKVYIDGADTAIDVSAEVMNNRTMVPIRFVAEYFGLDVEWDGENQTIEIEESGEQTEVSILPNETSTTEESTTTETSSAADTGTTIDESAIVDETTQQTDINQQDTTAETNSAE